MTRKIKTLYRYGLRPRLCYLSQDPFSYYWLLRKIFRPQTVTVTMRDYLGQIDIITVEPDG